MRYRLHPLWWPVLALFSPLVLILLGIENRRFRKNQEVAEFRNKERLDGAAHMELPELEYLKLTVLVEEKAEEGFLTSPAPSYFLESNMGSLLFDVGYGPESPALLHNANRLGFSLDQAEALAISHEHPDHMGGLIAQFKNEVRLPPEMADPGDKPCFVPDRASARGLKAIKVKNPEILTGGIASTGPLARSLFFQPLCEEQALVAKIKGKGLVIVSGCGHPTIGLILEMVRKISDESIFAIVGGFHLPVTDSPFTKFGIKFLQFVGTGKPPWQKIDDRDLDSAIKDFKSATPARVLFSAHDTCAYSLGRLEKELNTDFCVLSAGKTYEF